MKGVRGLAVEKMDDDVVAGQFFLSQKSWWDYQRHKKTIISFGNTVTRHCAMTEH